MAATVTAAEESFMLMIDWRFWLMLVGEDRYRGKSRAEDLMTLLKVFERGGDIAMVFCGGNWW